MTRPKTKPRPKATTAYRDDIDRRLGILPSYPWKCTLICFGKAGVVCMINGDIATPDRVVHDREIEAFRASVPDDATLGVCVVAGRKLLKTFSRRADLASDWMREGGYLEPADVTQTACLMRGGLKPSRRNDQEDFLLCFARWASFSRELEGLGLKRFAAYPRYMGPVRGDRRSGRKQK